MSTDPIELAFTQLAINRAQEVARLARQEKLAKLTYSPKTVVSFDGQTGRAILSTSDGGLVANGDLLTTGAVKIGQVVNTRRSNPTALWVDSLPYVPQPSAVVLAGAVNAVRAVPILFTRINDKGDREFWLGGDRDNPVLLDTFPPLSLVTSDWMDGVTVVAPPGPEISARLTATTSSGGFSQAISYTTTVAINIPTYLLAKVTGSLVTDPHMSVSVSTFGPNYVASQINSNSIESVIVTATKVTTTDISTATSVSPNLGGLFFVAPGDYEIYLTGNIATNFPTGLPAPSTGELGVTATYEFIPCYLSATATKRFVLLQPEPGVLNYYEIESDSNDFVKTSYTAPDPVVTDPDDWRSPFASQTQLTPPFDLGTPCENPYFFEYAPTTQLFSDAVYGQYASNIVNSTLARLDGLQGGDRDLLYQHFEAITGGFESIPPEVTTQDVDLVIDVSTLTVSGASCTVGTVETETITAKSLQTPDALILAIAPVVVDEG